jgi:hypothetical protein
MSGSMGWMHSCTGLVYLKTLLDSEASIFAPHQNIINCEGETYCATNMLEVVESNVDSKKS